MQVHANQKKLGISPKRKISIKRIFFHYPLHPSFNTQKTHSDNKSHWKPPDNATHTSPRTKTIDIANGSPGLVYRLIFLLVKGYCGIVLLCCLPSTMAHVRHTLLTVNLNCSRGPPWCPMLGPFICPVCMCVWWSCRSGSRRGCWPLPWECVLSFSWHEEWFRLKRVGYMLDVESECDGWVIGWFRILVEIGNLACF